LAQKDSEQREMEKKLKQMEEEKLKQIGEEKQRFERERKEYDSRLKD
jgi:hypothetical protein